MTISNETADSIVEELLTHLPADKAVEIVSSLSRIEGFAARGECFQRSMKLILVKLVLRMQL